LLSVVSGAVESPLQRAANTASKNHCRWTALAEPGDIFVASAKQIQPQKACSSRLRAFRCADERHVLCSGMSA